MADKTVRYLITADASQAIAAFQQTADAAKASAAEVSGAFDGAAADTTALGAAAKSAGADTEAAMSDAATSASALGTASKDAAEDTKAAAEDAAGSIGTIGTASKNAATDADDAAKDTKSSLEDVGTAAEDAGSKTKAAMEDAAESVGGVSVASKKATGDAQTLGSTVGSIGKWAALGLAGVAVASAKSAIDFQSAMTLLVTGAGQAESGINAVKQGILGMAAAVGQTPEELAKGMYLIESAGYHGAEGLSVLKAAAEGASVGNAQMATVANAVTTALTDYHLKASDAAAVTSALVETVASGKTNMEDLASSIGKVMPQAAALGISFQQVTGAMATMTNAGLSARLAAQHLSNTLLAISAPGTTATTAMQSVGLTSQQVKDTLDGPGGLTAALQLIETHVGETFPKNSVAAVTAFKDILGGATGYSTALMLTGKSQQEFETNVKNIGNVLDSGTTQVQGFNKVQGDLKFQLDQAKASAETLGIEFGDFLIPKLEDLEHVVMDVVQFFEKHKAAAEALAVVIGVTLVGAIAVWTAGVASNTAAMLGALAPTTNFGQAMLSASQSLNKFGNASTEAQAIVSKNLAQVSADADATATDVSTAMDSVDESVNAARTTVAEPMPMGPLAPSPEDTAAIDDVEGQIDALRAQAAEPIPMGPVVPSAGEAGEPVAAVPAVAAGEGTTAAEGTAVSTVGDDLEQLGKSAAATGGTLALLVGSTLLPLGAAATTLYFGFKGLTQNVNAVNPTLKDLYNSALKPAVSFEQLVADAEKLGAVFSKMETPGQVGQSSEAEISAELAAAGFYPRALTGLQNIYTEQAKDSTAKAQTAVVQGVVQQLAQIKSQDGANSTQYNEAVKGLQGDMDKWFPGLAKDKTTAQLNTAMQQQYVQAAATAQKLDQLTKDQTLKAAQSALDSDIRTLQSQVKQGASEATQQTTRDLINQELAHISSIDAAKATLAKDSTMLTTEKDLENAMSTKLDAVKTAINTGRQSVLTGGGNLRVVS